MNKVCIIAWMDDMDMGAHLAKLSTIYSYALEFVDDIDGILKLNDVGVIIIDLNNTSHQNIVALNHIKEKQDFTLIGFCIEANGPVINHFKDIGCDMVFKRIDLIRNLGSIIGKI